MEVEWEPGGHSPVLGKADLLQGSGLLAPAESGGYPGVAVLEPAAGPCPNDGRGRAQMPAGLREVRQRSRAGVRVGAWGRAGKPVWGQVDPPGPVRLCLVPVTHEASPDAPTPIWGESR